jgi:hypothetical protein
MEFPFLWRMAQKLFKLWVVLLIVSGGIASWFSIITFKELWDYMQLNAQAPATILKWEARDLGASRFGIAAEYIYEVDGISYRGSTVFKKQCFLNRFTAENHLKLLKNRRLRVWHRKGNPSFSSLEREFPQKDCLQALLTVGVFAYFYFARSLFKYFLKSS